LRENRIVRENILSAVNIIDIVLSCIAVILIGIPAFFVLVGALLLCFMRRRHPSVWTADVLWILSMFRLPQRIRGSQRWFVPVYYGSIGVALITPLALAVWQFVQMTRHGA